VDHIIPRSVVPELDNVIANLELLPQRVNSAKKDRMGARQRSLLEELRRAGLLSR
jgi:5-methylcytosine-specific restriction endonuclease McrA